MVFPRMVLIYLEPPQTNRGEWYARGQDIQRGLRMKVCIQPRRSLSDSVRMTQRVATAIPSG
jgi:hypothetical protein